MATMQCSSSKIAQRTRVGVSSRVSVVVHASVRPVIKAQSQAPVSRREALALPALALSLASFMGIAAPAQAFLGIGEEDTVVKTYEAETGSVLAKVRMTLAVEKGDESKEDKVKDLRKNINNWVARYRREPKVAGKPSFGNTYSALNTLAGHYNSFGTQAPVPKKRLERLTKELDDATMYLSRNR